MSEPVKNQPQKRKNLRTLLWLAIFTILMFGFGFAIVPLCDKLCQVTGLNGKTNAVAAEDGQGADRNRWVKVQFLANTNAHLPWEFYPLVKEIRVHPGENTQVAFYAKNNSGQTMTVQTIPSVTPGYMARYLQKTECFCFTQQTFKAGEGREMPLLFHIDKSLPAKVQVLTLSYTMFDTSHLRQKTGKTPGKIG